MKSGFRELLRVAAFVDTQGNGDICATRQYISKARQGSRLALVTTLPRADSPSRQNPISCKNCPTLRMEERRRREGQGLLWLIRTKGLSGVGQAFVLFLMYIMSCNAIHYVRQCLTE